MINKAQYCTIWELISCVLDFTGSWDRYISLMEVIIIVVIQVLVWLPMKLCMAGNVEPLYVGHN